MKHIWYNIVSILCEYNTHYEIEMSDPIFFWGDRIITFIRTFVTTWIAKNWPFVNKTAEET